MSPMCIKVCHQPQKIKIKMRLLIHTEYYPLQDLPFKVIAKRPCAMKVFIGYV